MKTNEVSATFPFTDHELHSLQELTDQPANKEKCLMYPKIKTRDDFLRDLISQFITRREQLGLSQEEVDAMMGNADRTVSKWECGQRMPTTFNLFCWAESLGCSVLLTF